MHNVGLAPALVARQPLEVNGHHPPTGQSREQATHCRLQYRRMRAQVRALPKRLVDDRIERDDTPHEVAPNRTRFRQLRSLRPDILLDKTSPLYE
jgi:hypothetical protein